METTIERLYKLVDIKGDSIYRLSKEIEVSNGYFSKQKQSNGALSSNIIEKIVSYYPDLDANWLLTGKGSMLKGFADTNDQELRNQYSILHDNVDIEETKRIPLVNITAIGGFGGSSFSIGERDVKEYYVIPKFKHKQIDFMIEVEGSSMYPKYNSGDVVACKIINEKGFIQWNKTHVIATKDQGIIIKRIKKNNEDSLLMVSDNKDYDPFAVNMDEINGIALVVGVIRLE